MLGGGGSGSGHGGGGDREEEDEFLGRISHHLMMPSFPPLHLEPSSNVVVSVVSGDDDFPRRDERVPQWGQQETRDLISIRADLERDFTAVKRNKTLWEVVSSRMKELGYRRTSDQCKCKWKNLVNRYKGKETTDVENGRNCPFFDEMQVVFNQRSLNMQRILLESESGSMMESKRVKRITKSDDEEDEEDEDESVDNKSTKNNSRKRKIEKEKTVRTDKSSKQDLIGLQDILKEFLGHQQRIEMMWREKIEKRTNERDVFEHEWRLMMEKLERERLMMERDWQEREEQRRIREECRAERRDALLAELLNKLNN
ncbi:trihelix transcription factor GT-3b-like isoform X2 [Impatiens glandulifera]|uniref:trihelix transcription factor GT-3b-like isoform X2 n=1 Tax=Impatiens glandulifera TaxID=253017 RepID=UPI001FB17860|nr:trihelix transcription factor GT-3b-like isoform X2 [Impatiens glandulifera]